MTHGMADWYSRLNEEQRQAVETTEGFVRVIAGAGSGKTGALSCRFAYLVNVLGIMPGNILCVTFTNKAASEMRHRIHQLTGDNDTGYVNTFHGFCVSILQEDAAAVSYPKSFMVLDNSDINAMLSIIYEERGLKLKDMTFSKARDMIEMQKLFRKPDYYLDMIDMSAEKLLQKYEQAEKTDDIIFYGYLYQEKKCYGLDYNDLIVFCLHIFRTASDIRDKWQRRLEYIMIDEFQDIDALQYELMEALHGHHSNLFIVGDPDQTVYTWRGADVKYILDFDKEHPGTTTITMTKNYRSTPQILDAANSLIDKNRMRVKKSLFSMKEDGEKVLVYHAPNTQKEAGWVAKKILDLHNKGVPYNEITLLYRAHYVTRNVETVLQAEEIPYRIYSGVRFYDRAEIKTAHSYLRMIAFKDDLDFIRIVNVPKRNIGEKRMRFLRDYAQEKSCTLYEALCRSVEDDLFRRTGAREFIDLVENEFSSYEERPVSELLSEVLQRSGFEKMLRTEGDQERLDNLAELLQSIYEYETTCGEESSLEHYLSHVALFTNGDVEGESDSIRLMTVHAAKGLEFENVFLIGMNEGVFPSAKVKTKKGMEEERRIAFVAMTRAGRRLYISESSGMNLDGSPRYPSRFIFDINEGVIEHEGEYSEEQIKDARAYASMMEAALPESEEEIGYSVGDRVEHPVFGKGEVKQIDFEKGAARIRFERLETEREISFRIKLKKIKKM